MLRLLSLFLLCLGRRWLDEYDLLMGLWLGRWLLNMQGQVYNGDVLGDDDKRLRLIIRLDIDVDLLSDDLLRDDLFLLLHLLDLYLFIYRLNDLRNICGRCLNIYDLFSDNLRLYYLLCVLVNDQFLLQLGKSLSQRQQIVLELEAHLLIIVKLFFPFSFLLFGISQVEVSKLQFSQAVFIMNGQICIPLLPNFMHHFDFIMQFYLCLELLFEQIVLLLHLGHLIVKNFSGYQSFS